MAEKIKLVSLLSNWNSGATLLTLLLNGHTQIVSNGETFPFDDQDATNYICSCGEPLIQCEFYREAAAHMQNENGASWNRQLFVQLPRYSQINSINSWLNSFKRFYKGRDLAISAIPKYRMINRKFLDAQLNFFRKGIEIRGSSIYMDGTKSVRRAELFAPEKGCDMKVIHLIRDGRAFCGSIVSRKKNRELRKLNVSDAAQMWLDYITAIDTYSVRHPQVPLLTVRYEDLCRDVKGTMNSISEFLEAPFENVAMRDAGNSHILGNIMRMNFTGEIVEDVSWKQRLSGQEIDQITRKIEESLRRFSYV